MNPSLRDQLKEWKRQHPETTPKKNKPCQKPKKRKSEHLSKSDIKSLMGMDMPTYCRHKGALRQK